jgi:CrcB protein
MTGVFVLKILAVTIFGTVGGVLRLILENSIHLSSGFPLSTLTVNLLGSFALGFFYLFAEEKRLRDWLRVGIGVGFIGAFTTFSTFSLDLIQLMKTTPDIAAIYGLGSILGGLICVFVGEQFAKSIYGAKTAATDDADGLKVRRDSYDAYF